MAGVGLLDGSVGRDAASGECVRIACLWIGIESDFWLRLHRPLWRDRYRQGSGAFSDPDRWDGRMLSGYTTSTNTIVLVNDAGNGNAGSATLGSAGSMNNSQCTLNTGASSVATSGN